MIILPTKRNRFRFPRTLVLNTAGEDGSFTVPVGTVMMEFSMWGGGAGSGAVARYGGTGVWANYFFNIGEGETFNVGSNVYYHVAHNGTDPNTSKPSGSYAGVATNGNAGAGGDMSAIFTVDVGSRSTSNIVAAAPGGSGGSRGILNTTWTWYSGNNTRTTVVTSLSSLSGVNQAAHNSPSGAPNGGEWSTGKWFQPTSGPVLFGFNGGIYNSGSAPAGPDHDGIAGNTVNTADGEGNRGLIVVRFYNENLIGYSASSMTNHGGWNGYTIIQSIPANATNKSGTKVKFLLQTGTVEGYKVNNASISEVDSSGEAFDSAADITPVLFNGANGMVRESPLGGIVATDWIDYEWDHTKAHLFAFYTASGTNTDTITYISQAGWQMYHRVGDYVDTQDRASFSSGTADRNYFIKAILIK